MKGTQSPGPGTYDVQGGRNKAVPGLGDAPTFPFGLVLSDGSRSRLNVPGPGTYAPRDVRDGGLS